MIEMILKFRKVWNTEWASLLSVTEWITFFVHIELVDDVEVDSIRPLRLTYEWESPKFD